LQTDIVCEEVREGEAGDEHAQSIMANGVIIIPPRDFEHDGITFCNKLESMILQKSPMA
jgi:hypothetical protein